LLTALQDKDVIGLQFVASRVNHPRAAMRATKNEGTPVRILLLCALLLAPSIDACLAKADCIEAAARRYDLSPEVLRAMAHVESGDRADAWNRNHNGSLDIGRFQINSSWWPTLERLNVSREALWDPCASALVAAWILAQEVERFGWSWRAIGAYHTGARTTARTEARRARYAARVARELGGSSPSAK
jgi:soluble lytic murein transglycosylase-like protein